MNFNNNNREKDESSKDMSDEDKSDDSKTVKKFDAILKDIKKNGRTTKLTSVKIRESNVNLHPLIIELINAGKTVV